MASPSRKAVFAAPGFRLAADLRLGLLDIHAASHKAPLLSGAFFGCVDAKGGELHSSMTGLRQAAGPHPLGLRLPALALATRPAPGKPRATLRIGALPGAGGLALRLEVVNTTDAALPLAGLDLLKALPGHGAGPCFGAPARRLSMLRHGWDSWDVSESLRPADFRPPLAATLDSHLFTAAQDLANPKASFVMGYLSCRDMDGRIRWSWSADGKSLRCLRAFCEADGLTLAPGQAVLSEPLLVLAGGLVPAMLDAYLAELGRRMGARVPSLQPAGWCTWYRYWGKVRAADVARDLEGFDRRGLDMDLALVDDGWQRDVGDWTGFSPRFRGGLKPLALEARRRGKVLGAWIAPFLAATRSPLCRRHPDWFIQDPAGKPLVWGHNWGGACACLDPSHPAAQNHLRAVFGGLMDQGVRAFKLDFLLAGALPGTRHLKGATRVQAYRAGLSAIRACVGEAFVLGCGAPIGPSIGLVDAMRIGRDTGPKWSNRTEREWGDLLAKHPHAEPLARRLGAMVDAPMKRGAEWLRASRLAPGLGRAMQDYGSVVAAIQDAAVRAPMHGRLWANDGDCVLLRGGTGLTAAERRCCQSLAAQCGGLPMFSDASRDLTDADLLAWRAMAPAEPTPCRALDLMERRNPGVLVRTLARPWGRWSMALLMNAGDKPADVALDLAALPLAGPLHAFDFWSQQYLGLLPRRLAFKAMAPHGHRLVRLTPHDGRPCLVGSSLHLSQGGVEVLAMQRRRHALRLLLRPPHSAQGRLWFWLPAGLRFAQASIAGGGAWADREGPLWRVALAAPEGGWLELALES